MPVGPVLSARRCRATLHAVADYSQDDFNDLCRAIRKYVDEGMDQWASFRLPCRDVDAFVLISLQPEVGSEAAYPLYDPGA